MHSSRKLQLEQATLMVCVGAMRGDFLRKIEFAPSQFAYLTLKIRVSTEFGRSLGQFKY
jgi:hypothetical protein